MAASIPDKGVIEAICTMMIEQGMSDLTLVDTVLDCRGFTEETRKKVAEAIRAEVAS